MPLIIGREQDYPSGKTSGPRVIQSTVKLPGKKEDPFTHSARKSGHRINTKANAYGR